MKMSALIVGLSVGLFAGHGLGLGGVAMGQAPAAPLTPAQPATPTAPVAPVTPATPAPKDGTKEAAPKDQAKESLLYFSMKTSKGEIVLELNNEKAPLSTANFKQYAEAKHYDGTIFHRVIDGFMIQGGGFTPDMKQKKTNPPIKNESANGLKNEVGTIAMARTNVIDSATSQFYINVANNASLNRDQARDGAGYAVFGKVVAGMDVVNAIKGVKTGSKNGMGDVPNETVLIESVTALTADEAKKAIEAATKK
jgi:cyclophilin family peptidyl-prolyl cis-trans isomerase